MEGTPHLWARRGKDFRGLPDWSVIRDEVLELEMADTMSMEIFMLVGAILQWAVFGINPNRHTDSGVDVPEKYSPASQRSSQSQRQGGIAELNASLRGFKIDGSCQTRLSQGIC
jgi:hypothetical protein